jgi:hypothetical protein
MAQEKRKGIPQEQRIGAVKLSPSGKSVMVFLDDGKRGMVSVKSMEKLLGKVLPYAVIRIPEFKEPTAQ